MRGDFLFLEGLMIQAGRSVFAVYFADSPTALLKIKRQDPRSPDLSQDENERKCLCLPVLLSFILLAVFLIPSSVNADTKPKRIISLAPNLTEILFYLGLGDRIIGVTDFCDYPEEAKTKKKIGGMSNPSLEAIIMLKPDIVVMTTDGNPKEIEERLRSFKIRTYVFRARQMSEMANGIRELGAALGIKEKADSVANDIEKSLNKFRSNAVRKKRRILYIVWPEPLIVAGKGTAIDDAITLLGNENIASKAKTSYPKYSIEEIIRQSPDLIIIGKGHSDMKELSSTLLKKLQNVPAVKNNKVFFVSDNLYRLGPRIIRGIEEMNECLR